MPVVVTFTGLDTTGNGIVDGSDDSTSDSAAEKVVDMVTVKVAGTDVEAELDAGSVSIVNGTGTATYIVDLSDEDVTVDAGDNEEVKIYVTFNDQDGNYNTGVKVSTDVNSDDISAEGEDELSNTQLTGNFSGEDHTLMVSGAAVTFSSEYFLAENVTDGVAGTIRLSFKVEAIGDDVVLADDASDLTYALTGASETDASVTCSGMTPQGGDYTISEGDTKTCTLAVKFDTTLGFVRLTITDVAGTSVSNMRTQDN
jgi:hypothetical protein